MSVGLFAAAWYALLCKFGLHGVKRVENGWVCSECYDLRWRRGLAPRAARRER